MHPKAAAVHAWLQENPEATVQEIAAAHELGEAEVVALLESHAVIGGALRAVEPGAGGGWVQPSE